MKIIEGEIDECRKIQALLDHYLSHELSVESTQEVVKHFEGCPRCRRALQSREVIKMRLREAIANEAAPTRLRKQILRLIRKENDSWFSRTFGSQKIF